MAKRLEFMTWGIPNKLLLWIACTIFRISNFFVLNEDEHFAKAWCTLSPFFIFKSTHYIEFQRKVCHWPYEYLLKYYYDLFDLCNLYGKIQENCKDCERRIWRRRLLGDKLHDQWAFCLPLSGSPHHINRHFSCWHRVNKEDLWAHG